MNRAFFLTILLWAGVATSAGSSPPPAPPSPSCDFEETSFDSRALRCAIPAGMPQRYRLQVNFSGGHDDTMASMTPRLDGAVLDCDEGSKIRLMGEDGDVSLVCIFSTPARTAEEHVFEASISFSHAQYVSYAFGRRQAP